MEDRKSTRLNSSHLGISYAVFCLKKKKEASALRRRRPYDEGGVSHGTAPRQGVPYHKVALHQAKVRPTADAIGVAPFFFNNQGPPRFPPFPPPPRFPI